ncbi:ATP-binding cassette domain-containing protein, partial [Staphylococcus aureus]|nr:ATP-binding cassette domain-containing protein [Staphylococcus aureus]
TTVLNMIAGLRKADEAIIEVNGQLLTDTAKNVNVKIQQRRIGYLFQDYQLFPNMTVYKNITFMAEPSEHIDQLIQTLNIDHLMKQYPMTLSG